MKGRCRFIFFFSASYICMIIIMILCWILNSHGLLLCSWNSDCFYSMMCALFWVSLHKLLVIHNKVFFFFFRFMIFRSSLLMSWKAKIILWVEFKHCNSNSMKQIGNIRKRCRKWGMLTWYINFKLMFTTLCTFSQLLIPEVQ